MERLRDRSLTGPRKRFRSKPVRSMRCRSRDGCGERQELERAFVAKSGEDRLAGLGECHGQGKQSKGVGRRVDRTDNGCVQSSLCPSL